MFTTLRTILRLFGIAHILARHGVIPFADRIWVLRLVDWLTCLNPWVLFHRRKHARGVRMRMAMEELGPTFIKFGQALSTRMDVLPDDIGREMKKLQDAVPPFPCHQVKEIMMRELGGPVEQFFRFFEDRPVASASIAQVHYAVTIDFREVAVKVMRPGIDNTVESDITMLHTIAELIEENVPDWRRFRVRQVVEEFTDTIRNEMNFLIEAARAQQFAKNFENDPILHIPQIHWELSTRRVLTMEWLDGIPIDELPKRPELGIDLDRVSREAVTIFFKQVFRDGYFHADQHPGNIFVLTNGRIAIVDFGIVGQVSMQTRLWLAELMKAFLMRDYRKVAKVHLDAGYIPPDTNLEEFEEAARQIGEPIFGRPLGEISIATLLADLFRTTERFSMEVQPQLLLLQKTMLTLEGVGRELNPKLNVWLLAEPLIRDWMIDNLGPKGKLRSFREGLEQLGHVAGELPWLLQNGLERLVHDRLRVRLHPEVTRELERRVTMGMRRQTVAVTGAAWFIGGALLGMAHFPPWLYVPALGLGVLNLFLGNRGVR